MIEEKKSKGNVKITEHFSNAGYYPNNSSKKKAADQGLANFIAEDMRPVNLIRGQGFKKFMKIVDPRYQIPSRDHVTKIIKAQATRKREQIKKILADIEWFAFTTDGWTSRTTLGFLSITSHFISKQGYLECLLISCNSIEGRETGNIVS